jgi:hypothetical protein
MIRDESFELALSESQTKLEQPCREEVALAWPVQSKTPGFY